MQGICTTTHFFFILGDQDKREESKNIIRKHTGDKRYKINIPFPIFLNNFSRQY